MFEKEKNLYIIKLRKLKRGSTMAKKILQNIEGEVRVFVSTIQNPRKLLFDENHQLDTEKLSILLNDYVRLFLKESVKNCNFTQDQIPQIAVQSLITLPPGTSDSSLSFGNYNQDFNFIEINKDRLVSKLSYSMSDESLMKEQLACLEKLYDFNATRPLEQEKRQKAA